MLQEMVSLSTVAPVGSTSRDRFEAPAATDSPGTLSSFELAERLVQAWIRSDQHLRTLDGLNARLTRTRRYLDSAPPRRALAEAYVERLRQKRAACLAMLEAERRTALGLMRESDARAAGGRRRALGA